MEDRPAHVIRWMTPSPKVLDMIVGYRNERKGTSATTNGASGSSGMPTSSSVGQGNNYVGIVRNSSVSAKELLDVFKHVYIVKEGSVLDRIKGLKIDFKEKSKNEREMKICVYYLSEKLAEELGIKKRVRCRKSKRGKNNINNIPEPRTVVNCEAPPQVYQALMEAGPVEDGRGEELWGDLRIRPNWIPYDRSYVLDTGLSRLKYNRSSWTKFPVQHILVQVRSWAPEACNKALFKGMLSPRILETSMVPSEDLIRNCYSQELDQLLGRVVKFWRRTKHLHTILVRCLGNWVWREKKKEADKARKKEKRKVGESIKTSAVPQVPAIEMGQVSPEPFLVPYCQVSRKRALLEPSPSENPPKQKKLRLSDTPSALLDPKNTLPGSPSSSLLQLSNFILSPTVRTNKAVQDQRKSLCFSKLRGKISHNCIIALLSQLLDKTGIGQFLGSRANTKKYLKFVRRSILLGGTKSKLQLFQLMQGLDPDQCRWLDAVEHPKMKLHLFAKISAWIFQEFIILVLRTSFYVTESSSSRNQLEFYLRNTWKSVSESFYTQYMKAGKITKIEEERQKETVPNATLRLIPKANLNLRPIVAFTRTYKKKINTEEGRLLLAYMSYRIAPHAVSDPIQLQAKWKIFLTQWNQNGRPILYFLRSDIRDAYPSVKINKLRELLDSLEVPYKLKLYTYMSTVAGGKSFKLCKMLGTVYDTHAFIKNRPWCSFKMRKIEDFDVTAAMNSVTASLSSAVVKIGKKKYLLDLGLPQGWQLSQHLCNIYYGRMDQDCFSEYLDVPGEFFVRNVDDYFFISTDPRRVASLRHIMGSGIPAYGCFFNSEKSSSNLRIESNLSVEDTRNYEIKFCGWKLSLATGHVMRDLESYKGIDCCSTLSFAMSKGSTPEDFISKRLALLTPLRLHGILFNSNFNCWATVLRNVFQASLMVAFRFYAMCRVLYPSVHIFGKDAHTTGKLFAGILHCANLISGSVLKLYGRGGYIGRNIVYSCSGSVNTNCDPLPRGHLGKSPGSLCKEELLFVFFHAFILKVMKNTRVFKDNLLPKLRKKKWVYAHKISVAKSKEIVQIVGDCLPVDFASMRK